MKLEIVPMEPIHLRKIGFFDRHEQIPDWASYKAEAGRSYTAIAEGEMICCFGVALFWDGLGELWMITGKGFKRHAYSVAASAAELIEMMIEENHLRHCYADVVATDKVGRRFIERYGFVRTGYFKYYDVFGRDVIRYSREVDRARSGT